MTTFLKDPDAVLDYSVDWSKWLAGDQIETSAWFFSDPVLQPSDDSNTTTRTTVWLSGGMAGQSYTVTNGIVTSGGRTDDRSFHDPGPEPLISCLLKQPRPPSPHRQEVYSEGRQAPTNLPRR